MGLILNSLCYTIVSQSLFAIVVTLLSSLLLNRILLWIRLRKIISKIPGPKGVPILGNTLSFIGSVERK